MEFPLLEVSRNRIISADTFPEGHRAFREAEEVFSSDLFQPYFLWVCHAGRCVFSISVYAPTATLEALVPLRIGY